MKYIQTILIAILLSGGAWFIHDYTIQKKERLRFENNQSELFQAISSNLQKLELTDEELHDLLKNNEGQLSGVLEKLENSEDKILGRINRISNTIIESRDTTTVKIILDSIGKIKNDLIAGRRIEIPIDDKTECFEFKARFVLSDKSSFVEVLDRKYNDTITHVSFWERNRWKLFGVIPTRLFGRKIVKVVVFNNCGFSKTIVIDTKK